MEHDRSSTVHAQQRASGGERAPELRVIYDRIGARTTAISAEHPEWPCRKGCDSCCRRLARAPEATRAEWRALWPEYLRLPADVRRTIRARVSALAEPGTPVERNVTCPLLDREAGACLVYAARPAACRAYGFYLSRGEGLYCDQVNDRVRGGLCDDVVWGNHDALTNDLERAFGPPISMIDWFAANLEPA